MVDLIYHIKTSFDASHQIMGYNGPCANIHGHTYDVLVNFYCKGVNLYKAPLNMHIDFSTAKRLVEDVVQEYDHQHLNNLEDFRDVQPTAEMIAIRLLQRLLEKLRHAGLLISKVEVTVFETREQGVTVSGLVD